MYLKTGLFINQAPEHESPVLLDMVAEAEQVMRQLPDVSYSQRLEGSKKTINA